MIVNPLVIISLIVNPLIINHLITNPLKITLDNNPLDNKSLDNKPLGVKPLDSNPIDSKPIDNKPLDNKPIYNKFLDNKPIYVKPLDVKLVDNKPFDNKPLDYKKYKLKDKLQRSKLNMPSSFIIRTKPFLLHGEKKPLIKVPYKILLNSFIFTENIDGPRFDGIMRGERVVCKIRSFSKEYLTELYKQA